MPAGSAALLEASDAVDLDETRAFLRGALESRPAGLVAISVPAPAGAPEMLLERLQRNDAFHLRDERRSITTLGCTTRHVLSGPARFDDAATAHARERDLVRTLRHPRAAAAGPLWTFGFAFAVGRIRDPWAPFGDGLLVLPRWIHRAEHGSATLTLVVGSDEPSGSGSALTELDALWDALSGAPDLAPVRSATVRHLERDRWCRSLDDVRARIEAGSVQKVVVARRSVVTADEDIDPVSVLQRLVRPGATTFCVRRRGVAFVGATPERLFRKRGRVVHTEAIAGTASLERDPSGRRLLSSAKDAHEHQLVVDGIVAALASLRADVSVGPRALRTIGSIAHLATPIEARLGGSPSAFAILDALHPTPAVGGAPREAALSWIADHEPDRGWYAGPLGWIDAQGDADAHVALRSALVVGARAYAYAGCGVVAGSDPLAEYAETALKLAPMLAALGARA